MKIAIITGPRRIIAEDAQIVSAVVREIVGDADGVDAIAADEAYPRAFQQFFPRPDLGRTPAPTLCNANQFPALGHDALCEGWTELARAESADGN